MARNFVEEGRVLALVAPYDRTAGDGALVGGIFGVALGDVLNAAPGQFQAKGVWDLTKTNAQAWAQGAKIYWDDINKRCDSSSAVGPLIGIATDVALNPSATGRVRLNGVAELASGRPVVADVATANAADLATTEALVNQLKTTANALLGGLRAGGIIQ